jgi:hypothetical protein
MNGKQIVGSLLAVLAALPVQAGVGVWTPFGPGGEVRSRDQGATKGGIFEVTVN